MVASTTTVAVTSSPGRARRLSPLGRTRLRRERVATNFDTPTPAACDIEGSLRSPRLAQAMISTKWSALPMTLPGMRFRNTALTRSIVSSSSSSFISCFSCFITRTMSSIAFSSTTSLRSSATLNASTSPSRSKGIEVLKAATGTTPPKFTFEHRVTLQLSSVIFSRK